MQLAAAASSVLNGLGGGCQPGNIANDTSIATDNADEVDVEDEESSDDINSNTLIVQQAISAAQAIGEHTTQMLKLDKQKHIWHYQRAA